MTRGKKILLYLLGLMILAVVFHAVLGAVLHRRLRGKIAEVKAQGDPVSVSDLMGTVIPAKENGALQFEYAFREMKEKGMTLWDNSEWARALRPCMGEDHFRSVPVFDPQQWDHMAADLARFKGVLRQVEAAIAKPRCRFAVDWEDGHRAGFPYLSGLRWAADALRARAVLEAHSGDMTAALRSTALIIRLSESLSEDPSMSAQASRWWILSDACRSIRDIAEYGKLSEGQAKSLEGLLGQIDLQPGFIAGLKGERALALITWEKLATYGPSAIASGTSTLPPLGTGVTAVFRRPVFYADELVYLNRAEKRIRNAGTAYRDLADNSLTFTEQISSLPWYADVSGILLGSIVHEEFWKRRDGTVADIHGARIFLGLVIYRNRFGEYPVSLQQLRSRLGWELPEDPFSGMEFRYRRVGETFWLYSVGENLRDDGGRLTPVRDRKRLPDNQIFDDRIWCMRG